MRLLYLAETDQEEVGSTERFVGRSTPKVFIYREVDK